MKITELALHNKELGFTPRDPVRWLAPIALARTALKVMTATVFADFGDKRELEAGLPGTPLDLRRLPLPGQHAQPPVLEKELQPPSPLTVPAGGLWLDFTADLGDGFDATYTVAYLLAQDHLAVEGPGLEGPGLEGPGLEDTVLKRGNILVLGGDEVYPVASPAQYEDRMLGPYRNAFPAPPAGSGPPAASCPPASVMLALPGNHDWYDGLTSFIRVFTRQRSIGSWRTIQNRSYFALRLSGGDGTPGWWLLGLDSQLGQYIDEPQLDYFYRNVTCQLVKGDSIILCLASPSWVYSEAAGDPAFRQADFFEQDYLRRRFDPETGLFEDTGAEVRLWLSGDLHHYSRYEETAPAPVQLITCGLGGAYLSETHWLPPEINLPEPVRERSRPAGQPERGSQGSRRFVRAPGSHPATDISRQFALRLANPFSPYWLPARNPAFGPLLGLVHAVVFLAGWGVYAAARGQSLMAALHGPTLVQALLCGVLCPLLLLGLLVLFWKLFGGTRLLRGRGGLLTMLRGVLYQLAALGAGICLAVLVSRIPLPSGLALLLVLAVVLLSGWVLGSEAFALYILRTRGGEVASWKMSGQAVEDHKGFLRMRLDPGGSLTVHPLLVETVCRDWELQDTPDGARPVPAGGLPAVRLLEQPVTILPTPVSGP